MGKLRKVVVLAGGKRSAMVGVTATMPSNSRPASASTAAIITASGRLTIGLIHSLVRIFCG